MNFNHLYYFHLIATEGSLVKAARRLHLSQPTLSAQLKLLEEYVGARLFDRSGSSLRLNESGRKMLRITEEMFRAGDKLGEIFKGEKHAPLPRLEVGVTGSVSRSLAVDKLVKLLANEQVVSRVRQSDHEFLYHELLTGSLDLLITDSVPHRKSKHGVKCKLLSSPRFVIVAPAKWRGDANPQLLNDQPFIHYTPHNSYRFEIDQWFREQHIAPRIVAEADDIYLIREAVAAGVGAGIIPSSVMHAPGDKKIRQLGEMGGEFPVHAIYQQKDPSREVLAALEVLTDSKS